VFDLNDPVFRARNDVRVALDRLVESVLKERSKRHHEVQTLNGRLRMEDEHSTATAIRTKQRIRELQEANLDLVREVLDALPGKPQMREGESLGDVVRRAIVEATRV